MLKPKPEDIRRFLLWLSDGPWHLVAIDPERKEKLEAEMFDDVDSATEWAEKMNRTRNLYYTLNPLVRRVKTKPSRKDIAKLGWIHVDIDPRAREELKSEQERIESMLAEWNPKPSAVVFSGGGYQALWRLEDGMAINGQEEAYEEAKLFNKQMEVMFGADNCHNVDRILRVPGTINWPDETKRKKGREPALSEITELTDIVYPLSRFQKAPKVQQREGGTNRKTVEISGNIQRIASTADLGLPLLCRTVIAQGHDPDDTSRFASRSDAVFYVCCEMVRNAISDDTIFAIITDPDWAISAHVLEQPRPEDYAVRQIERAHEFAIDPELVELNDQFAVVRLGGQVKIMSEDYDPVTESQIINFLSAQDFGLLLSNRYYIYKNGDDETPVPLAKWWLNNPMRREYRGVIFLPGRETPGFFNLWRGFSYEARPGDCTMFLEHVRKNICRGNEEWFNYLLGWMAHAVQKPHEPGHTAVVFRGKQGTGKGFFANHFGRLFGRHYLPVRDSNHIFGQFNGHLQDCVILFADESFWVDSTKQKSMLKNLITESEFVVERKRQDAQRSRNCVHLIMASNEKWVVPLEGEDRRFFVLDVGEDRMQDNSYFAKISDQMHDGGYEALLHLLLNHDISEFDIRRIPYTEAAAEQKAYTLHGEKAWWYHKLCEGRIYDDQDGWPEYVFTTELCHDFVEYNNTWERSARSNQTRLGVFLKSVLPTGGVKSTLRGEHAVRQLDGTVKKVSSPTVYQLPNLKECRQHWEREHGKTTWPSPVEVCLPEHVENRPF
jgi:hypothetical protein